MAFSAPFSELSRFVERLERRGVEVRGVTSSRRDLVADGVLAVTVEFGLPLADALDASWVTVEAADGEVAGDGRLGVTLSVAATLIPDDVAVRAGDAETTVADRTLVVSLPVEIPVEDADRPATADGGAADAAADRAVGSAASDANGVESPAESPEPGSVGDGTPEDAEEADRDLEPTALAAADVSGRAGSDVPVFRDHDRLQAAYDSCDTFAEMTESLGLEVTAETVRRYMIDAGIHEPDSYDMGADATDEGADDGTDDEPDGPVDGSVESESSGADDGPSDEVVYADGIGLPDGLTVQSLIAAITESNTLHEVSHALDVERGRARDALAELNLLDLVVGRLAMEAEREVTREEVVERLREADTGA